MNALTFGMLQSYVLAEAIQAATIQRDELVALADEKGSLSRRKVLGMLAPGLRNGGDRQGGCGESVSIMAT